MMIGVKAPTAEGLMIPVRVIVKEEVSTNVTLPILTRLLFIETTKQFVE